MKKILFALMALMCSMSMNAQVMKVMKGNVVVATYTAAEADNVVFEEAQGSTTTGTAAATEIGDVNWVQLWADGPKFADRNVEGTKTFTEATTDPFIWGASWCTPSKDDMEELVNAASSTGSEKVACEYKQVGGAWGFEFKGKTAGYESNSVFFPAQDGGSDHGDAFYWSGTASGDEGWFMYLDYSDGDWGSEWIEIPQDFDCLVRPVLKN